MQASTLQRIGLVSFVLREGVVVGWPGHHREVQRALAEAGCDGYVTSVLPPATESTALGDALPPETLRLVLAGAYLGSGERAVVVRRRGSGDVVLSERAVPGKPGDRDEPLAELSEDVLARRVVHDGVFVLIEREINLLTYTRVGGQCREVLPISSVLADHNVWLVAHTAAKNLRRWETNPKRAWLSRGQRLVVAVWSWNATGHAEPIEPWRIFYDGELRSATEIPGLPYARIATVDVADQARASPPQQGERFRSWLGASTRATRRDSSASGGGRT